MKKSKSIRLALLGTTGFALAACDEAPPTDARFYANAEAPRFTKKEECEAEFGAGNCETRTASDGGGGSFFLPLMMGYMMGKMGNNVVSQPVYRDAKNTAYAGGGRAAGQPIGRFGQGATAGRAPDLAVARGGFGEAGQSTAS